MALSAWRDAVSYGAYLQPIHLELVETITTPSSKSAVQELPSQASQNSRNPSDKSADASSNGTPVTQQALETGAVLQTAQNAAQSTAETSIVTVIPPFTCESLNGGEQMALNVGGPVWAMDWLPSKPAANAAAVAAALIKSKEKKPRRSSAASKKAQKAALKGKENNQVEIPEDADGHTTAASNGSSDPEKGSKLEWRFLALATHPPCQVEEGKVVKNTPPDHYYDVPESARNLIQIWAVPVQRPKILTDKRGATEKRLVKPRLVFAIDHESGVAWDLQWCPLVKKFPKTPCRENILGILAACFGDGSMRVFEIPAVPEERLQMELDKEQHLVDKNIPIVVARLPRIMQLSVQWSPHTWNVLLTGGSDGSVSLWNIKSAVSESDSLGDERIEPEPIEPQRRFQDADTIGKQEAFDWGCGWVAIRAVAWSPFDEHLFATTGNDSVFKVWDVREPRVCLRSHRIRSTWGLALQWMDQTSIQISGDQGSVYMYDILSGSYQKLHFHPQIDSPVWDLQFARRGAVPLLISSCTSGSIRAAPAKKLYRAPQNCVEICRLSGQKDSSIEQPFKSLRVSFDKHSVLGSADTVSQSTREFCERDAALHRLRLSSSTPGDYPCYLAAGGHAGLVILFEMQETLDTLIPTFFMPPSKKTGRPKKIFATVGGHHVPKKKPSGTTKGGASNGRKARTLGSFAKAKGMHTALSKYKKKALGNGKKKANPHANATKKSFIQEDGEVEVDESVEEEEEPEFEDEDEEEDESDLSLVMGDSSDDDRISVSDNAVEEEEATAIENPEEARLMKEYQLDLSEEDAILLAIQMSVEDKQPAPANAAVSESKKPAKTSSDSGAKAGATAKKRKKTATSRSGQRSSNGQSDAISDDVPAIKEPVEDRQPEPATSEGIEPAKRSRSTVAKARAPAKRRKTRGGQSSNDQDDVMSEKDAVLLAIRMSKETIEEKQPVSANAEVVGTSDSTKPAKTPSNIGAEAASKERKKTATTPGGRSSNAQGDIVSEDIAPLGGQTSEKLVEENQPASVNAVTTKGKKPAKRSGNTMAKAAKKGRKSGATPDGGQQSINGQGDNVTDDALAMQMSKELVEEKQPAPAVPETSDSTKPATNPTDTGANAEPASKKRKKTAAAPGGRRSSNAQGGITSDVAPAAQMSEETVEEKQPASNAAVAAIPESIKPARAKAGAAAMKRKRTATIPRGQQGTNGQGGTTSDEAQAIQLSKELVEEKQPACASAAIPAASESKKPAKRSSNTKAKAGAATKRKKTATTPRGRRRNHNSQGDIMSEEDALRLALAISELEY
ncbi:hypothetical protein JG687_00012182 [Phytophthora cactorum]|uniref:Uncharacterized protein n=1 Tax=Phytophthora cactorum TaxID=29920 RepID=A0A8T1U2J8_9STRA|nr:hypothetical protein PC120_g17014 [Phytophthora cactorum]KAG3049672.1 hypothetical protein PC121_g18802 [Phytophthora cactorum]KAG3160250.1 hypothetical protein PC128_g21152 [Phytophthora cactorum]KAG6953821.1 hypothetical protein JG687_00012182 [Phytophthora cactorum]